MGEKLGENEVKILESISSDPHITIQQLSEEVQISTTAVENNIKKLKEKDLLKRVGSPKGGHWEVIASKLSPHHIFFPSRLEGSVRASEGNRGGA